MDFKKGQKIRDIGGFGERIDEFQIVEVTENFLIVEKVRSYSAGAEDWHKVVEKYQYKVPKEHFSTSLEQRLAKDYALALKLVRELTTPEKP